MNFNVIKDMNCKTTAKPNEESQSLLRNLELRNFLLDGTLQKVGLQIESWYGY